MILVKKIVNHVNFFLYKMFEIVYLTFFSKTVGSIAYFLILPL